MKKSIIIVTIFLTLFTFVSTGLSATYEDAERYYKEGNNFYDKSDFNSALNSWEKGLKICRDLGNKQCIGVLLTNIGLAYWKLGHYNKALSYDEKALVIHREIGDREGEGDNLNNIGIVYTNLGQYDKALSYYEKALVIYKKIGYRMGEGTILGNIGVMYWKLGQYNKALSYYEKALVIDKEIGDRSGEGTNLNNIGVVYDDLGQYDKALSYYEKALLIYRDVGNLDGEGNTLKNIGKVFRKLGQYNKALSYFEKSLIISKEIGDRDGIYKSSWGMGSSYKGLKKYSEAVNYYIMSIDALEEIRGELKAEEHKTSFMGEKMEVYEELIEILIDMGRYDEAYNYMERSRSRAFLDLLASARFSSKKAMDKETQRKDSEYQNRLSILRSKLMKDYSNETLKAELAKLEAQYEKFIKDVNEKNGEMASLISVKALKLKDVQRLLPNGNSIIEYISTDDKTLAFLVTKNDLKVFEIPIKKKDLNKKVNDILIPNISNKRRRPESVIEEGAGGSEASESEISSNRQKFIASSKEFYDLLIKPVSGDIKTKKIIIIPYGSLHKVPFVALNDGTEYLIDKYSISILPSASVLEYLKGKGGTNNNRLLAFADPKTDAVPLYYAETEVAEIKNLFSNNKIYSKGNATETNFKNSSGNYDIVHMACHGEFNDTSPLLSCLLLSKDGSNDGYLRLNELFGLDLTEANLVTLSACETGLSKVKGGDDLVGMSRGLIYAGAESILASLWSVDDKSTAILMTKFYENWKSGMTKAEALRQAQVHLKSMEGYEHPFYWAAFELIGDGK